MVAMFGHCPHCNELVTNVHVSELDAHVSFEKKFAAVAYVCPSCQKVLAVGADPVALAETIAGKLRDQR